MQNDDIEIKPWELAKYPNKEKTDALIPLYREALTLLSTCSSLLSPLSMSTGIQ